MWWLVEGAGERGAGACVVFPQEMARTGQGGEVGRSFEKESQDREREGRGTQGQRRSGPSFRAHGPSGRKGWGLGPQPGGVWWLVGGAGERGHGHPRWRAPLADGDGDGRLVDARNHPLGGGESCLRALPAEMGGWGGWGGVGGGGGGVDNSGRRGDRVHVPGAWLTVEGACGQHGHALGGRGRDREAKKHKRDENTQNNNYYPIHSFFIFFFQFLNPRGLTVPSLGVLGSMRGHRSRRAMNQHTIQNLRTYSTS